MNLGDGKSDGRLGGQRDSWRLSDFKTPQLEKWDMYIVAYGSHEKDDSDGVGTWNVERALH